MAPRLSVVVHVELEAHRVCVEVTGELTARNQQVLHGLVHHARTLGPTAGVRVDLSQARVSDPVAVDCLRQALTQDPVTVPVELRTPVSSTGPHPQGG